MAPTEDDLDVLQMPISLQRGRAGSCGNDYIRARLRLASPAFQCRIPAVDCGMVLALAVPSDWVLGIETQSDRGTKHTGCCWMDIGEIISSIS